MSMLKSMKFRYKFGNACRYSSTFIFVRYRYLIKVPFSSFDHTSTTLSKPLLYDTSVSSLTWMNIWFRRWTNKMHEIGVKRMIKKHSNKASFTRTCDLSIVLLCIPDWWISYMIGLIPFLQTFENLVLKRKMCTKRNLFR